MRENRNTRRADGHTLMSRRGKKLKREMNARREEMQQLDMLDTSDLSLMMEQKSDRKELRGNTRRRANLMKQMRKQ